MGLGQRFTQATASSMSLTSQSQKPATNSRAWAKGPSMTARPGPSNAIRLPCEEGLRPSATSMMPALRSSSLNLPIASIASFAAGVGRKPFSLSSVAFTITITRIVCLPCLSRPHQPGIGTTYGVFEGRHHPANILPVAAQGANGQLVAGVATVVDDVFIGGEDAIG